jgi:hypothetical protein
MFSKAKAKAVMACLCAGGAFAAAPVSASAATPACGPYCIGVFSSELGTYSSPNFVEHVFGGSATQGTETGLTAASNTDSSEDFMNPMQGDVDAYYNLGMVSEAVDDHYHTWTAAQLEYAPDGNRTGLCVGVATDPYTHEPLSLQPCTVPGRTVWIIGSPLTPNAHGYFPIISGATSDFAHPYSMTYPKHVDVNRALPPIRLAPLKFVGPDHSVPARQLWGVVLGPLSQ